MRRSRAVLFRAIALAALALPATVVAQTPPPVPDDTFLPASFIAVTGAYTFSGCVTGQVDWAPGTGAVFGTPFCLSGRVTLGRALYPFGDHGPIELGIAMLEVVHASADPRVSSVTPDDVFQSVMGPGGGIQFSSFGVRGYPGRGFVYFTNAIGPEFLPTAPLTTASITTRYTRPGAPSDPRSVQTNTFALTAVPEPSTYAMLGAGMLGVVGLARRRLSNRDDR